MNKISFIAISLLFTIMCSNAYAQNYSSDAQLVSFNNNIATIKCSGIADKKKDAAEMAVKSAIYTYLVSGIAGLNDDLPLIENQSSQAVKDYIDNLLGGGRYSIFVQNIVVDKDASRKVSSGHMASITFTMYPEAIYKDMLRNKIIMKAPKDMSLAETEKIISLPSIMVIPYCSADQSYLEAIQGNPDMRMAMSRVTEGFINKGVETKDFEQSLRIAEEYQARQGDLSLDDAILNAAGADVAVQVDISKDSAHGGLRISMRLTAIDVATGSTLGSKSETSARKNAGASVICAALAQHMVGDFLKQISTRMAHKISQGSTIAVNFTIDPNSMTDMDTEMGNTYLPLSDAIIIWIKENAKEGKYSQKGRSTTMLALDEININNEANMNINDFSLGLYRYLRGLGLTVKRNIVGNTLHVTIM